MPRKSEVQESISNLSMGLIEHGLTLLQTHSFPVYKKNIDQRDPPFAPTEFTPSAIAILLMSAGLDYHLARLKWFRDITPYKPPLPYPTYFNWNIGDPLSEKISKLLIQKNERSLKEQLVELTIVRDSVAHPRLYLVKQAMHLTLASANPEQSFCVVPNSGIKLFGESSRARNEQSHFDCLSPALFTKVRDETAEMPSETGAWSREGGRHA